MHGVIRDDVAAGERREEHIVTQLQMIDLVWKHLAGRCFSRDPWEEEEEEEEGNTNEASFAFKQKLGKSWKRSF